MNLEVRAFFVSEWQIYRDIRLAALKDSPDAFGSVYEDAVQYSDALWQQRLENATERVDLPLIALADGNPAGLCWARIDDPANQYSNLFSMWVAPQYRRLGLSRMLMNRVIEWSQQQAKRSIELDVTVGNHAAERLYRSLGFQPVGDPVPLREDCELLEQTMGLDLHKATE